MNSSLTEIERERYMALAVFPKGMPLQPEMLQALWGVGRSEALNIATRLVELSLARRGEQPDRIVVSDPEALWGQFPDREALRLIHRAHELASQVLGQVAHEYPSQLIGRLKPFESRLAIGQFIDTISRGAPGAWLRPLQPATNSAGTPLIRVLTRRGSDWLSAVNWEKRLAVSVSKHHDLIKVWNIDTGAELFSFAGHRGERQAVAISRDGRLAATGARDREVRIWDLRKGGLLRVIGGFPKLPFVRTKSLPIESLALSADGTRLIVASGGPMTPSKSGVNSKVEVWDLPGGNKLHTLVASNHDNSYKVAISPDGRRAITSTTRSEGGTVLWDLQSGSQLRTLHEGGGSEVKITGDGKHAANAYYVWDLDTGSEIALPPCKSWGELSTSDNARWGAEVDEDRRLRVWDLQAGTQVAAVNCGQRPHAQVAIDPDGKTAVISSYEVCVFSLSDPEPVEEPSVPPRVPFSAAKVDASGHFAVYMRDSSSGVWDLATNNAKCELPGSQGQHWHDELPFAISADGRLAVGCGTEDREHHWRSLGGYPLNVWDVVTGLEIRTLEGHANHITGVALSKDGRIAVSSSWDHTLKGWDLETGRNVCIVPGARARRRDRWDARDTPKRRMKQVALSADGGLAVCVSELQERDFGPVVASLEVWDMRTGRKQWTLAKGLPERNLVAITPGGTLAALAPARGPVRIWDLRTGGSLHQLGDATDEAVAIVADHDGRYIMCAYQDNSIRIWNLRSGGLVSSVTLDKTPQTLAFLSDGRLMAIDQSGGLHRFDIVGDPVADAAEVEIGMPASSVETTKGRLRLAWGAFAGRIPQAGLRVLIALQWLSLCIVAISCFWQAREYLSDRIMSEVWGQRVSDLTNLAYVFFSGWWLFRWRQPKVFSSTRLGLIPKFALALIMPATSAYILYPTVSHWTHLYLYEKYTGANGKVGCELRTAIEPPFSMSMISYDAAKNSPARFSSPSEWDDVDCEHFTSFGFLSSYHEYTAARRNGLWGLVDRSFHVVIPPRFQEFADHYNYAEDGLVAGKREGKWGYVSIRTGKTVIPFQYDGAQNFKATFHAAWVKQGTKWGRINRADQLLIPFIYDDVAIGNGLGGMSLPTMESARADKRGFVEHLKDWLLSPPTPYWVWARQGDLWGTVDTNGRVLLEPSVPGLVRWPFRCDTEKRKCYVEENEHATEANAKTQWNCKPMEGGASFDGSDNASCEMKP